MTRPDEELSEAHHLDSDLDPAERDLEAPPADVAEQAAPITPEGPTREVRRGWQVDEWDALEQSLEVDLDDEDYR